MIVYCDFINGDDDTGDGSAGNPYKTIDKASTGLTGGDEVRVAKSPAPTNLTGTLAFTLNSTAIVGTNTLFNSELAIGDFIKGDDDNWWEVVVITDDTHATLFKKYSGSTESEVSSQKLGITSTGAAANYADKIQQVSASGSSAVSRLKISGGWDLTGPTQDGQTYFRQMYEVFSIRWGYGLHMYGKSYLEIERLHFLRYSSGLYINTSSNNIITSPICNSNSYGISLTFYSCNNTITSPICNSNVYGGIYFYTSSNNIITSPVCDSNTSGIDLNQNSKNNTITSPICNSNTDGFYFYTGSNNTITDPICNYNDKGIYLYFTHNNIITSLICNNNDYGVYACSAENNTINKFSGTGNTTADVFVIIARHWGDFPCVKFQHFKVAGDNRCYFEHGVTYRDTANARSTQCLKYDPISADFYISQSFFFKASSGVAQTLSAYIKKEAAFNGDVQGAIYFMGKKITGWTALTPSANDTYEQKSLVAALGDITEDGVLELRIKVRGTAGNVFVDDLNTA